MTFAFVLTLAVVSTITLQVHSLANPTPHPKPEPAPQFGQQGLTKAEILQQLWSQKSNLQQQHAESPQAQTSPGTSPLSGLYRVLSSALSRSNKQQEIPASAPSHHQNPFPQVERNQVSSVDNYEQSEPATPGKKKTAYFYARCKDCNIALGDKELLNFMKDMFETVNDPEAGRAFRTGERQAFDGECTNCNVLIGGPEAMTSAANTMFSSLRGQQQFSPNRY